MFRKRAWEEVGGFDNSVPSYEDWDFWIRIMQKGWLVESVPESLFNYRIHLDSGYFAAVKDDESIQRYIVEKYILWHKTEGDFEDWIQAYILMAKKVVLEARNSISERNIYIKNILVELSEKERKLKEKEIVLNQILNSNGWRFLESVRKLLGMNHE